MFQEHINCLTREQNVFAKKNMQYAGLSDSTGLYSVYIKHTNV